MATFDWVGLYCITWMQDSIVDADKIQRGVAEAGVRKQGLQVCLLQNASEIA